MIFRLENVERECVAVFLERVNNFFELGEHGLSKKRAANVVDLPVDDVSAHFRIARLFEQMMREQFLVEGRCNLGQKNRIIVVLKALRFLRKRGMHGVAGFVRERVNIGKDIFLVIHQDVRRRAVASGRERAAAFGLRFVTIAPAAAQTFG